MSAPLRSASLDPDDPFVQFYSYVQQKAEEVDLLRNNLGSKYSEDELQRLHENFASLAGEFKTHQRSTNSPYYSFLRVNSSRSVLFTQLVDQATLLAGQLERYADGTQRYSPITLKQLLNSLSASLHDLLAELTKALNATESVTERRESTATELPTQHIQPSGIPSEEDIPGPNLAELPLEEKTSSVEPTASAAETGEQELLQQLLVGRGERVIGLPLSTQSSAEEAAVEQDEPRAFKRGFNTQTPISTQVTHTVTPVTIDPSPPTTEPDSLPLPHRLDDAEIDRHAISDQSLCRVEDDQLGFAVYVNALHAFIASPDTSTPITIGIDGAWGSGKTSLMRMVQSKLDPPQTFAQRLSTRCARMGWLIRAVCTWPIWLLGKLLLRFDDDPTAHNPADPQSWPWPAPFWSRIAEWHCLQEPPIHPTIWFNAWKFDQEEQLWAALALDVMRQIKQRYGPVGRFVFWLRLTLKRFTPLIALGSIFWKIALPLALGLLALQYDATIKAATLAPTSATATAVAAPPTTTAATPTAPTPGTGVQVAQPEPALLPPIGQWLLILGALVTGAIQISKIVKDPFQLSADKFIRKPDYAAKIGFLGAFETDFAHIVALATRRYHGWNQQKLVVFIDDLDRCEPPKSVDIIEAVNLLLDSQSCVFVIGMDSAAVIASIETKYEALFKRMRQGATGMMSPGRFFLDKIIQVPFQMPATTEQSITKLVDAVIQPRARPPLRPIVLAPPPDPQGEDVKIDIHPPPPPPPPPPDPASYARADVQRAIREGARLLTENPRQIKRFVNVFRLHVYVINQLEMFEEQLIREQSYGLTLDRLAVWVAWSIRWVELAKHLAYEGGLQQSWLRAFLMDVARLLKSDGSWIPVAQAAQQQPALFQPVATTNGTAPGASAAAEPATQQGKQLDPPRTPQTVYDALVRQLNADRKSERPDQRPWLQLPWEWWLLERDFLKGIKTLERFWERPQRVRTDWLRTMLMLTRVDFEAMAPAHTDDVPEHPSNGR